MGRVTISDAARRHIAAFESETGATARDCVVDEERDQVVFVVAPDEMGAAIGTDGGRVRALEESLGRSVRLVEDADRVGDFVANALAPAAVYSVAVEEREDGEAVARVEVDDADRGVAIGAGGDTIETARMLARRHFDLADVELVEA
jgi:N utilization substance protein A